MTLYRVFRKSDEAGNDWHGFREHSGPVVKEFPRLPMPVRTGATREGLAYSKADIDIWVIAYAWAFDTERIFMNVEESLRNNYESASALWETYKEKLDTFRNCARNDMTSLEAAARKTKEAAHRMVDAYASVFAQLNGADMERAIQNAERLAAALKSISEARSHQLVFSVADGAAKNSP